MSVPPRKKILYFYYSQLNRPEFDVDPARWKILNGLESTVDFGNVALKVLIPRVNTPDFVEMVNEDIVLGIVFLNLVDRDLRNLSHCRKPMFFSIYSFPQSLEDMLVQENVFYLKENQQKAASEVTWHVLEHGHRNIFFLKSCRNHNWELERENSIKRALSSLDSGIQFGSFQHPTSLPRYIGAKKVEEAGRLKSFLTSEPLFQSGLYKALRSPAERSIASMVGEEIIYECEKPQFDAALAARATVWICSNDDVASQAMRFLRHRGLRVPDHISLVSFDNNRCSRRGVSSYDLGYGSGGILAAQLICNPELLRHAVNRTISLPGFLVERGTVGPPAETLLQAHLGSGGVPMTFRPQSS